MNCLRLALMMGAILATLSFVGCDQPNGGVPASPSPENGQTENGQPAEQNGETPAAGAQSGTQVEQPDVRVDVGDGVDVEVGENLEIEVDREGVNVQPKPEQQAPGEPESPQQPE